MARQCGFKIEATEGTSVLGAAVPVTPFGFMGRGFPIPFASRDASLTFQANTRGQKGVTLGAAKVEASYDFDYGNAAPWLLTLGDVVHGDGVSTITLSDPDDLPSFSIYSETNGKAYATTGCKVEQLVMKIVAGEPVACEMDVMGWNTVATDLLNGTEGVVTWPASADTTVKGWSQINAGGWTFGSDDQGDVYEMIITAANMMDAAHGMLSPIATGIDVLETGAYMASFRGNFRGSADDLMAAFLAETEDDFVVKFDLPTAGNYHQITLKDMIINAPAVVAESEKVTSFRLTGWASGDCIEVKIKDGCDYSSLLPT